ncbi:MAG: TatD family hydrolase [Alistipes sp.]|nr:TatD family hydrolase [Alistipes sp.]
MAVRYIDIHTHRRAADALCVVSYGLGRDEIPAEPGRPFSAGIHPWDAAGMTAPELVGFIDYLCEAPLAAVGEAGLDYVHGGNRGRQAGVFRAQCEVARERGLPVIVHCVRAHNDLFPVLEEFAGVDFILHGYMGSPELTRRLLDAGCYFSLGERSLGSEKTLRSLVSLPADRIFAETDESPVPVAEVYRSLARAKGMDEGLLAGAIEANYIKVFR